MSSTQYLVTDYSNQGFGVWRIRGFSGLGIGTRERFRKPWVPSFIKYSDIKYSEALDWL